MGWYALHPLNHDPLIWFCISPWWANIPEIKISCGASIKNSLLTWETGTPALPRGPEKGDGTHACMLLSRQTHVQANTVFATLHEDFKTNSSHVIENIEEFPPELGFSHQPCPLCSVLDNIQKFVPAFIMHRCRCNLHIFSITVFATTALCGDARVNAFFHLMHHSWYNFWDWIPPGWHHVVKSAGDGFRQKMSAKRKQCWAVSSTIYRHMGLCEEKKSELQFFQFWMKSPELKTLETLSFSLIKIMWSTFFHGGHSWRPMV